MKHEQQTSRPEKSSTFFGGNNFSGLNLYGARLMMRNPLIAKGFTLIELLVVISIIAILASMLLPVLNNAKLSAQNAKCISNLKQVSLISSMYLVDYKEFFPIAAGDAIPQVSHANVWACKFLPYISKDIKPLTTAQNQQMYMNGNGQWYFPYAPVKVFSCPNFPMDEPNGQMWRENGMHFGFHTKFSGKQLQAGIRESESGVRTWIFSETCNKASANNGYYSADGGMCAHRHRGVSVNSASLDGRVQNMRLVYNTYFGGATSPHMVLPKMYRYYGTNVNP